MRYVELVKRGFVVAGDLSDEENSEHLADGYCVKWQQTMRVKAQLRSKKVVQNKHGIRVA